MLAPSSKRNVTFSASGNKGLRCILLGTDREVGFGTLRVRSCSFYLDDSVGIVEERRYVMRKVVQCNLPPAEGRRRRCVRSAGVLRADGNIVNYRLKARRTYQ